MILKLGMKRQGMELFEVYIHEHVNHESGMPLTYFTVRSTWVANVFESANCQSKTHYFVS